MAKYYLHTTSYTAAGIEILLTGIEREAPEALVHGLRLPHLVQPHAQFVAT